MGPNKKGAWRSEEENIQVQLVALINGHFESLNEFAKGNADFQAEFEEVAGQTFPATQFACVELIEDLVDEEEDEKLQQLYQLVEKYSTDAED